MNEEYFGKKCPFCKTEFKSNDDIVVCSECDMPHHKDCWILNEGCTTFGCSGTMQYPNSTTTALDDLSIDLTGDFANENSNHIYCSKCGKKNYISNRFCSACGNQLVDFPPSQTVMDIQSNYYANEYNTYNNSGEDDFVGKTRAYTVENSDYYCKVFTKMRANNQSVSWNGIAFLFTPFWFISRKMYGIGVGIFIGALLFSVVTSQSLAGTVIIGVAYLVISLFANNIYMKQIEKNINKQANLPIELQEGFVKKNGGIDKNALIISIVAYVVVYAIAFSMG